MGASHEIDEVAGREERRTVPPLHGAFLPSVAAALLRARRSPAQQSLTVGPLPAGAQPARRSRPAPPAAEPLPQRSDMSCRPRRAGPPGAERPVFTARARDCRRIWLAVPRSPPRPVLAQAKGKTGRKEV